MSSLFGNKRKSSPDLVTLPAFCVPAASESDALRSKREAQIRWMREKGVRYLIDTPIARQAKKHTMSHGAKASLTTVRSTQTH
jgi:hypothetical protein